jgi:6,7-dimethyl-8-ribityllumazine synthase
MTSSDLTLLPDGAKERIAARVGISVDGAAVDSGPPSRGRVGFACAEFNGGITDRLLTGALDALERAGCDLAEVVVAWAPGAFELPMVAQQLATSGSVEAVVCLGAVIRGDTGHYEFVAGECASGLQRVQLDTGIPVVFGVLTTDSVEQALVRSEDNASNKGLEAAETAVKMIAILSAVSSISTGSRVGFSTGGR